MLYNHFFSIIIIIAAITIGLSITGAFHVYSPRIQNDLADLRQQIIGKDNKRISKGPSLFKRDTIILSSWLKDTLNSLGLDFFQEKR